MTTLAPVPEHETEPVVIRDVFPAAVAVGDDRYWTARAIVTRERVYVFTGAGRERLLRLDQPYDREASTIPRYNAPPRDPTHLVLDDGRTLSIARARGCGCTSPLRSWHPWQPYRIAAA